VPLADATAENKVVDSSLYDEFEAFYG
jgi:6-phosphofructokinase 1